MIKLKHIAFLIICLCLLWGKQGYAAYLQDKDFGHLKIEKTSVNTAITKNTIGWNSLNEGLLKEKLHQFFLLDEEETEISDDLEKASFTIGDQFSKDFYGYQIRITVKPFEKDKHSYTVAKTNPQNSIWDIYRIDGKKYYGSDLEFPIQEIKSFEVKYQAKMVDLPNSEYSDLFNLAPDIYRHEKSYYQMAYDKQTRHFLLIIHGSDGAGAYTAIWIFQNGKYIRRIVE